MGVSKEAEWGRESLRLIIKQQILSMWQDWINAVLGLAVLAIAVFGGLTATLAWALGVVGVGVIVFALWGVAAFPESTVRHA